MSPSWGCVWAHPEDCWGRVSSGICHQQGKQQMEKAEQCWRLWQGGKIVPKKSEIFGEPCLAVGMLTDCCSPRAAKGPQLSLKGCRNRKGKPEGKTHPLPDRYLEMGGKQIWLQTSWRNLKKPQMKKVILQKNWQNKGEEMKELTGSDYPGIAHHFGHCKLNLIIGTCGKQAHCCAQAELESRRWFCRCRRGHPKFHPEIAASWRHIIIQIWDHEGQGELQLNTLSSTLLQPLLWHVDFQCTVS